MPQLQEQLYDISYIEALPEGVRAELIDGVVYNLAAPSGTHQRILGNLTHDIIAYIRRHRGPCQVFPAPYAVYLFDDEYTYLEPDLSVICDPSKLDEKGCHGAPDFVIEIVSPTSRQMDYMVKFFRYHDAGVKEYWIVDPTKKTVRIYDFIKNETEDYPFEAAIPSALFPGLTLRLANY